MFADFKWFKTPRTFQINPPKSYRNVGTLIKKKENTRDDVKHKESLCEDKASVISI